jgi:DNA-binding CsgD family transcriptional regulator
LEHLILFFYLLTLLAGVAALGVFLVVYFRTKYRLLLDHILYSLAFTLFIFSYLFVLAYANLNLNDISFETTLGLLVFIVLAWSLLLFSIPFLAHSMVYARTPIGRNLAAALVAIVALACVWQSFQIDMVERTFAQTKNTWFYLATLLFASAIIYSLGLKAVKYRTAAGDRKRLLRAVLTLNLLFIPGVAGDYYLFSYYDIFIFLPLFYASYHVLVAAYVARMYLRPSKLWGCRIEPADLDEFLLETGITPREREIVGLILEGAGNKIIAERLFIAPNTVKTHVRSIFQKLNVSSRFELLTRLNSALS